MLATATAFEAKGRNFLDEARKADLGEAAEYGHGPRPKDLPEELKRHRDRLAQIREAKHPLEEEVRANAAVETAASPDRADTDREELPKEGGGPPPPSVDAKVRRNFAEPASRIAPDVGNEGGVAPRFRRSGGGGCGRPRSSSGPKG